MHDPSVYQKEKVSERNFTLGISHYTLLFVLVIVLESQATFELSSFRGSLLSYWQNSLLKTVKVYRYFRENISFSILSNVMVIHMPFQISFFICEFQLFYTDVF